MIAISMVQNLSIIFLKFSDAWASPRGSQTIASADVKTWRASKPHVAEVKIFPLLWKEL